MSSETDLFSLVFPGIGRAGGPFHFFFKIVL